MYRFYWQTLPALAPYSLYPWLTARDSLTARLRQYFSAFNVQVMNSSLSPIHKDEMHWVNLPRNRLVFAREVMMCSHHTPLVYARSITQPQWLMEYFPFLRQQGSKPLGPILFANPKIRRSQLALTRIRANHPIYNKIRPLLPVSAYRQNLWARRSWFQYGPAKLLITEVFMPDFELRLKFR